MILREREMRLVALVAQGWTNREIGTVVNQAPDTVAHAIHRLQRRLGARNRAQFVARCFELGFLEISVGGTVQLAVQAGAAAGPSRMSA